jgi:iron complex outermembrane receptor protein
MQVNSISKAKASAGALAVALCGLAAPTWAQDAAATQPQIEPTAQAEQAVQADQAQDDGAIVVTARRREETLMDVPIAIATVDSKSLESKAVNDLRALDGFVPNVNIQTATSSASSAQIYLRGVGVDDVGFGTDPNVGVYLDDVFIGRLVGSLAGALDLERIEVLRGPQGTLYGRNSTGGAVKFVTRKPNLNDSSAKISATLGTDDRRDFKANTNIVLSPGKAALILAAQTRDQDGYIKLVDANGNDTGDRGNGVSAQDYRAVLRLAPVDDLTIDIAADYTRNRSGIQAVTPTDCASLGTRPGLVTNAAGAYVPGNISAGQFERCPLFYDDPYTAFRGPFSKKDPRFDGAGIASTINWETGLGALKWVSSYRGFRDVFASSLWGKPPPFTQVNLRSNLKQRQIQQELQLSSSNGELFDYTVGLFYFREKVRSRYQSQIGTLATVPRLNDDTQISNSYAVFGEFYIRPIENLEVTLGGRYSLDRRSVDRELYSAITNPTPTFTYATRIKSKKFTPKLGLSYDTGPLLVFASYTEGYRTPGFITSNPSNLAGMMLQSKMETEKSIEGGFKAKLLDNKLNFSATAFSAKYNNLQATLTINGITQVVTADAKIEGLEFETSLRPARGLSLFANAGLMKTKYTSPPAGQPYARDLKHAPGHNFVVGGLYETAIGDLPGTFFLGGDLAVTGKAFRNVANTIDQQSDAYELATARAGYRAENDRWSVTVGGTNLLDKTYYMLGIENQARAYQPGRRFYATVETRF